MLTNDSRFPPIEEKEFLAGSRIASAMEKEDSVYLRNAFQKEARKFLEELTSTVLSTVAVQSEIGQRLSCFGPENMVGVDYAPFHLFGRLLDGFLELGCVRGLTVEASKAEYQSFVREQRQFERISTRS